MSTQVYLGNSLEVLRSMEDSSVDLIITSPPYADARKKQYGGVSTEEYVDWFRPFSEELFRVLSPEGSFILNIKERVVDGERSTYVYDLVKDMQATGWRWTEEYMWHKTTSTPGKWPNRFRDGWEHLYHFTKNKKFTMNQEDVMIDVSEATRKRAETTSELDRGRVNNNSKSGFGRNRSNWVGREKVFPSNVLQGPPERANVGHPAAFPLWIPLWFITLFSNPGETVLDPFLGSGTTLIAAEELDRNSIGIELKREYVDTAIQRYQERFQTPLDFLDSAAYKELDLGGSHGNN